jgi:GTP1/Obg family GTP-binding protein
MYWIEMNMTTKNKTDELTEYMIPHILQLHEFGLSQKAIQVNLYEIYHFKAALSQIKMITGKMDHIVNEWMDRMKEIDA